MLLKALISLGLKEDDAEIYLLLAREGPQTGRNIAEVLNLYKQQLHRSLKNLQYKGCVKPDCERPSKFSAVAIEVVVDMLADESLDEAENMEENRQRILSSWQAMMKKDAKNSVQKI